MFFTQTFQIKVSKREAKAEEIRQEHAEMMEELALLEEKWASIQKVNMGTGFIRGKKF